MTPSRLIAGAAVLAALALALAPPFAGLSRVAQTAAGLSIGAIALWATAALPEVITALLFLLLAIVLRLADAATVLSGFTSTAWWLVFGGLVVGVAVKDTGLGARIAHRLARRFGRSYLGVIAGTLGIGLALAFVMPSSMGRLVLLLPIVFALAERMGFRPGSNGSFAMVLAMAYGTYVLPLTILPANIANNVLAGAADRLYGVELTYGSYLVTHFPVMGALKGLLASLIIARALPDNPQPMVVNPLPPMSRAERKLAVVLLLSLLFWVTDFLHHVSPAWVSLAAATACMLPGVDLVGVKAFNEKISYSALFYLGAVLGVGALIDATGLGAAMAKLLLSVVPLAPDHPAANFALIVGVSTAMGLLTMHPGMPATMAPLCGKIAEASGLSLESVLMLQAVAFSTLVLPYQAPPMVVGQQMAALPGAAYNRICFAIALATLALLMPLDYLWLRFLDWL